MTKYVNDIVEEDRIKCNVCNQIFNTDTITLDEYNFAWDGYVTTDCCNECSDKVLVQRSLAHEIT